MFQPSEVLQSARCLWIRFSTGCFLGLLLAYLISWGCATAQAQPLSVVIVPGDQTTQAAIQAVKILSQDQVLEGVHFKVLPSSQLQPEDIEVLAGADVAFVHNMGRNVTETFAPAIARMAARKSRAFAIGAPFEDAERQAGLTQDEELRAYAQAGGTKNIEAMVRRLLQRDFGYQTTVPAPTPFPRMALWNSRTNRFYSDFDAYAEDYLRDRPEAAGRAWVGVFFNRATAQSGQSVLLESIVAALEARGLNVASAYGPTTESTAGRFFLSRDGRARVAAVVGMAIKIFNTPGKTIPVMRRLDVPVVNAITLSNQSLAQWEASPQGLSLSERAWQLSSAEFGGDIAPTVVATKERHRDAESGLSFVQDTPVPERVARLADRIQKLVALRYELNANKRVAVIYYNYPPGKENIGAAYLNVMPRSLWQILTRLKREGYSTQGRPENEEALFERLREHGVNVGAYTPGALEKLIRGGNVMLLPLSDYRKWFDLQPKKLRDEIIQAWGEPEQSKSMVWKDGKGKSHFVFPAQRFGNLVFAPQPARASGGDVKKMYHDVALPPNHQYLAFYLWLQKGYQVHAMVHVGTHATHEWQSGKEVGFTNADPGEALVADVPQLYPYIVDDIGEALQAKRRGMAAIISHMTPPFDKASLNKELTLLKGLIDDYIIAVQKSESATVARLAEINAQAGKLGVLKDIGKESLETADDVEMLEHYLKEIGEKTTPYGLHTFGVAPEERLRLTTADAILEIAGPLTASERAKRRTEISEQIVLSATNELDALVAGLAGRHIVAGPGSDPIRNPDSLPTGRNLYGFDPARMPTPGTWDQGRVLAEKFVTDYQQRHGQYPDRVVFNLWSIEAMRHEGVIEAEIMALMGVRPVWDERGRTSGVEVIPRQELGRPRVDVTMVPTGLYRDALPNLMQLLDSAVSKIKVLEEEDNPVRTHVERARALLIERGISADEAVRLASVRIFTEPPGVYGVGIEDMIQASNTWKNESEVADVYFNRIGHVYGQGYWGEQPGGKKLAVDIFKMALKGSKAVVHSRSSNVYGVLDNDDNFQYLGGTALAIRQVDGRTPETHILNLSDPKAGRHETLDKYMGRELRTRYTNPEWIKSMMKEGYSGARYIKNVTDNLWGWQVTVPEAVDGTKWNEMYETYVTDRNQLGIKQMFREAKNLLAYQAVVDRMLVAINKGYWKADPVVKATLERVNREVIAETGVACDETSCSSQEVSALAKAEDRKVLAQAMAMSAPDLGRQSALSAANSANQGRPTALESSAQTAPETLANATPPASAPKAAASPTSAQQVEGFEVKEQLKRLSELPPAAKFTALLGFAALVLGGALLRTRRRRG